MYSRKRGLTTIALAGAILSLTIGAQSSAQMAIPNSASHRFTPSTLRVDPESTTSEAAAASTDAEVVASEPIPTGFLREAPGYSESTSSGRTT